MADPKISQTNSTSLHQPSRSSYDSSSSYDPEGSTGGSSCEEPSNDDCDNSSLSELEEACSALQLDASYGSSTESLDGLADSHLHHHNQTLAESTEASTDSTTTPTTQSNSRALIDMRPLNAILLRDHLASAHNAESLMVATCDHKLLPCYSQAQDLMVPTLSPQEQAQFSPQEQIQELAQLLPQEQAQFSPPCSPCPALGSTSQAPPDIDGLVLTPSASNGTQSHTMATLPARTIKKFVQNYEDMPAAIRAFIRWFLSHEGRRFYVMNPIMANYIEGTTKYDRLTAIDHHQHDLTRRLCSTSMFSLTICMASSEHQHWIHASNSLCSFLASEYAFTAPPDSSIIDTDAIAFRTMNHQLDMEKAEIDYDSEGDFFNTFCDFNDDPDMPELDSGSDKDEIPEMEDLSLRTRAPDYSTRHNYRRCSTSSESSDDPYAIFDTTIVDGVEYNLEGESHNGTRTSVSYVGSADATRKLSKDRKMRDAIHSRQSSLRSLLTTTLTQWLRAPTVVIAQSDSIAACVNNWITNFSAHTALANRAAVMAFRMVNYRFANDRSAHTAVIKARNLQLLRTRRAVNQDLLERKAPNLLFIPSIMTLLQDSAPFCLLKRRRLQQHRSYLRSLMLEWMAQVADVSLRTAIIVGLLYEQYNAYLADLLQAWRLHLPYYPNHVMFIEFRCQQLRRALHSCHNAYLSSLLQIWLQRAQTLPAISQLNLANSGSPCNDVPLRGHHDTDDDDTSFSLREITHTLLQLSQTNREFLAHASFIDWGDSAADAPCSKWKQICSIWDSASNTCLINPNLIRSHWKWASRAKRLVTGVGGKQTECYGIVIVPIMSTFAGEILYVCSTVVDFHPIIDFMYGLDFQESHRAIFDPANYRVYLGALKETIRLDKLRKVRARLNAEPIGMVSICGGCDPPLGMALMMGFKVCFYLSIEKYEHTRSVAKGIYPQIIHVEPHDLMEIDIARLSQRIIDLKVSKVALTSGCPLHSLVSIERVSSWFQSPSRATGNAHC